jgi:PAS domain S-box-containing protein
MKPAMKTILLAYERDQDLAAVETLLAARGHRVVKAHSGVEALEMARHEGPHVIVSDVMLPRLDGFALCRRMKEDPLLQHVPVILHSFRVEGAKYEAFSAEVGAERFLPRGSTLEELAILVEEQNPGSGTMRIPALVPELLEKREKDRKRLAEVEAQLRQAETANAKLQAVHRKLDAARRSLQQELEAEQQKREELARDSAAKLDELRARVVELERERTQLVQAETRARGEIEQSQAELQKVEELEARVEQLAREHELASAAHEERDRLLSAQPAPTWLCDAAAGKVLVASDSAAALLAISPEKLVGRELAAVLPGLEWRDEAFRPAQEIVLARQDGSEARFELRRQSVAWNGESCRLVAARDVTLERAVEETREQEALCARALEDAPVPAGIVDGDGRFRYANTGLGRLLGMDPGGVQGHLMSEFEFKGGDDTTVRAVAIVADGQAFQETRWRRADESVVEVEIGASAIESREGWRVITVRDVGSRRKTAQRADLEQRALTGLLDFLQRAQSLSEPEIHAAAIELGTRITDSGNGCIFLATAEAPQVELVAHRGENAAPATRWRGSPPAGSALLECLSSQRQVLREGAEGTGPMAQSGLPAELQRQLAVPLLDGSRLTGVLLFGDKPAAYDEDDRRRTAQLADALGKALRRRRSDAEVISAMDHMERVMLGTVATLGALSESQDGCKTGRARRVADMASEIGIALGLPGHTIRGLRVMGQLVDVGMLQIPREILWRPGQLSAPEYELVRTHAERGFQILRDIEFPWPVAEVVRQHHERQDGSGYPRGLKGEEILLEARIIAVADVVEAMLAPRPQRPALSVAACIEELQTQAGRRYDARVVKVCVKLLRERENEATEEQPRSRIA